MPAVQYSLSVVVQYSLSVVSGIPGRRSRQPARKTAGEAVTVEAAGRGVRVSNPHKVFFAARGETKLDLVEYYRSVAGPLMETVGGRPVLLERHPDGASGKSFFQKRVPSKVPSWLRTTVVRTPAGTASNALIAADLAHVIWAVNLGCLGFHVWPFRAFDPLRADELRIDLDPQPGVGFDEVREAASEVRAAFDELKMPAFLKTSGGRGLHIYVRLAPRWDSFQVRAAAVALARELSRRRPDLITDAWWKEERGRRVFVDFNQNAPHKTVFGAWCVRPRPTAVVSTPIGWGELDDVVPDELTIATVPRRLAARGDVWAGINDKPASLVPLLEWHRRDMAAGLPDAPWPPQYPKMPNEPPRVAPSRARKD